MVIGRHHASLLMVLVSLGGACVGESEETISDDEASDETRLRDEQVVISQQALGDANLQPKSDTPGDWVVEGDILSYGVFRSKRDNPVLTASIQRRSTQESQVNPAENAAATIRYRLTLSPFPFDQMEPYADANDASGTIYHSVFGTRLSATDNSVTLFRDDWDQSAYSEGTTRFRLHPNVKLGRIRVVSFYVSAPHGPIRESTPSTCSTTCGSTTSTFTPPPARTRPT